MKAGMAYFPPILFSALRFLSAGAVLLIISRWRSVTAPTGDEWGPILFTGLVQIAFTNAVLQNALLVIDAGLASACACRRRVLGRIAAWRNGRSCDDNGHGANTDQYRPCKRVGKAGPRSSVTTPHFFVCLNIETFPSEAATPYTRDFGCLAEFTTIFSDCRRKRADNR